MNGALLADRAVESSDLQLPFVIVAKDYASTVDAFGLGADDGARARCPGLAHLCLAIFAPLNDAPVRVIGQRFPALLLVRSRCWDRLITNYGPPTIQ